MAVLKEDMNGQQHVITSSTYTRGPEKECFARSWRAVVRVGVGVVKWEREACVSAEE